MKVKYCIPILSVLVTFLSHSCTLDDNLLNVIHKNSVSPETLLLNGRGDECEVCLDLDGDWSVIVNEQDGRWLTVEPVSGSGPGKILLKSSGKQDAGYTTKVIVESGDEIWNIDVEVDEVFYFKEGFDGKKAPVNYPYPDISCFGGWDANGPGASAVSYSGYSSYVVRSVSSYGYDMASGGNSIYLDKENSTFDIGNIDVSSAGGSTFTVEFHAGCFSDTGEAFYFDETAISLMVSSNGVDYLPLAYMFAEDETGDWRCGTASFNIEGTDLVDLRFQAMQGGMYIDDIKLADAREEALAGNFIVRTGDVENLAKTSATLNGRYVYTGAGKIISTGFEYKVTEDAEISEIASDNLENTGFKVDLMSLVEGESYEFRAYAENSEGEVMYGDWMEFITLVEPVYMNVSDVRKEYDGTNKKLPASWVLKGQVVSDMENGNFGISQFAFVDGGEPGDGIIINLIDADKAAVENQFVAGTPLEISLRGARFRPGFPVQIDVNIDQMQKTGEPENVVPLKISTVADLGTYDGMLVSLDNVQAKPEYVCRPWGYGVNEPAAATVIEVEAGHETIKVKTLSGASHRLEIVGSGSGSLTGICVNTGDEVLIFPRNHEDVLFDGVREGELVEEIVYYEDFGAGTKASFANYRDYTAMGQNPNNVTFFSESKDGNVYTSKQPGGGYSGASGGNHGYVNSEPRDVYMKGLNTIGKKYMYFTMGASYMRLSASTESNKNNLVIKCSSDQGATWMDVPINVLENGTADCIWALVEFDRTFVIPESDDLWFLFTFKKNQGMMDDLKIVCYR